MGLNLLFYKALAGNVYHRNLKYRLSFSRLVFVKLTKNLCKDFLYRMIPSFIEEENQLYKTIILTKEKSHKLKVAPPC